MTLKPYPDYKESSSPLLGDIPNHWEVSRLRSALSMKKEIVGDSWSNHLLLSLTLKGVIPRDMENIVGKLPADFTTYQRVHRDDLIFCLFDVEETPRTVGWVPEEGMLTGAYTAASPNPAFDSKYIAYHYLSYDQQKSLRGYYAGLRNTIRSTDFANIPICFPPPEEQRTIVEYLDGEIAEIGAFIRDQEELIALLRERRTATITRAVTKGLTPGTRMKDSGVPWLGEVPAHWALSKLGHHYEVVLGKMLDGAKEAPIGARVLPYIRAGNIQDSGLDLSDVNEMAYTPYEAERLDLIAKDLLVVEGGSVGTVHYLDSAMGGWSFQKTVNRVRSLGSADTKYLGNLIRTFRDSGVFEVICNGSTIMHLTAEKLRALTIPVPTVDEQRSIAVFIDRETEEIDAAIEEARIAIALSKERRAAVISAAVTGKIDVRDIASRTSTNKVGAESVGVA